MVKQKQKVGDFASERSQVKYLEYSKAMGEEIFIHTLLLDQSHKFCALCWNILNHASGFHGIEMHCSDPMGRMPYIIKSNTPHVKHVEFCNNLLFITCRYD